MEQEAVYFGENGIIKSAFHKNKRPIDIGMKYFIGYRHEGNTFPSSLCVKLPQMNAYTKYFDRTNKYIDLRKIF